MYNLLIVDDREVFRRMIRRMPYFAENQDKFTIKYAAENGQEALELLQAGDTDVVLTDIRMPVMNGLELLKEIKKSDLCKCTILLSEYSDFSYAKEGIINGAFDYIVKPVDNKTITETFDRAFEFLQSLTDENFALMDSADRLARALLHHDEVFHSILTAIINHIERIDAYEEKFSVVYHTLEQIKSTIANERSYINNYMPIEIICTLPGSGIKEEDILPLFESRVKLVYAGFEKFDFSHPNKNIHDICEYIVENIDRPCKNKDIADVFHISQKYLSTLFKKETGISFVNFVTLFKIERAKMLLSYSDMKIYTIADALGFSDKDYFSKIFKKQTGQTPRSFHWDQYIENA